MNRIVTEITLIMALRIGWNDGACTLMLTVQVNKLQAKRVLVMHVSSVFLNVVVDSPT